MRTNTIHRLFAVGSAALAITMAPAFALGDDGPFLAENGLLVMEMESGSPTGSWLTETNLSGFTGESYLRWNGGNLFNTPGQDVFAFDFEIAEAGRYHFRLRNRHDHPDSTEANDVWVRLDGGAWVKTFSWQRGQWTWTTQHEFSHTDKPDAEYQLTAGLHRLEFSGRSQDFMLDRIHLFHDGAANPLSLAHPESNRGSTNDSPIAAARVVPGEVPVDDGFSTTVTLDSSNCVDPDGDALSVFWQIRGARFVDGTGPRSRTARIRVKGDFAVPVRLQVTDTISADDYDFGFVNQVGTAGRVDGAGMVWHPVTVSFRGPATNERATAPNPFLDYRFNLKLTRPDGTDMVVPGFFDGDGLGNGEGNVWRARFTPDAPGIWTYTASFRSGETVANSLDDHAGEAVYFDGATGRFGVLEGDSQAPGLLGKGRLDYVNDFYLQHQGSGKPFIKTGTNSPENFMGYAGFDGVQDNGGVGIIHEFAPHVQDWNPGDPLFVSSTSGVDSKGIIGALNYLGEQGVNSLYFLPMNLGGDGQETTPFVGYEKTHFDKTHYDISRLHQWNHVLNHAQEQGILVQFVLAETEWANEHWLDEGEMGTERKLFFRELVARFGYLNGVKWNLCEENDYPIETLREMASYMKAIDAYRHPVAVHTHPNDVAIYQDLVGDPLFDAASVQYAPSLSDNLTQMVRNMTQAAGRRWIVDMDENGTWNVGANGSNSDEMRKEVLYDVLFSNGGIEWYAGYHTLPLGGDVKMENFRTRESLFRFSRIAREFLEEHVDFQALVPMDHIVTTATEQFGGAEAMGLPGNDVVIFLPDALDAPSLSLLNLHGTFRVRWFDPRTGEEVAQGPTLEGGQTQPLQVMVSQPELDWIVFLDRD
ncbi:DUF5060 domain-containing protein [Saltatorellus ferox]